MANTRLFIEANIQPGQELHLDSAQSRYLGRVLRMRPGDPLNVFNGEDGEFSASLVHAGKSSATVVVGQAVHSATESKLKIHLVQGISRGERMDYVVQKATELGVKRITPVFTAYGVVRLDPGRADKRREHWQQIARSACEQCGRIRPPLIDSPVELNRWFGSKPADTDTDLILQPGARVPLSSIAAPLTKVCVMIGPEGGFSDEELEDARTAGFSPVGLGPRIMRTETAALASLAVAQCLWGDLSGQHAG